MSQVRLGSVEKMVGYDRMAQKGLQSIAERLLVMEKMVKYMEESYQNLFLEVYRSFPPIAQHYSYVRKGVELLFEACDPGKHVKKTQGAISMKGLEQVRHIIVDEILADQALLSTLGLVYFSHLKRFLGKCYPSGHVSPLVEKMKELSEDLENQSEEVQQYFNGVYEAMSHREIPLIFLQNKEVWLMDGTNLWLELIKLQRSRQAQRV